MPKLQPLDALKVLSLSGARALSAADVSRPTRRSLAHEVNLRAYLVDLLNQTIIRSAFELGGSKEEAEKLLAALMTPAA